MEKGAITGYFDVAQVTLYLFWIFFAGLIFYLQRESKREGYPLEPDHFGGRKRMQGFADLPATKTYILPHGGTKTVPDLALDTRVLKAKPIGPWPGAPLEPTGDPMVDGVGPAAWAERAQTPDLTVEGTPRIVPLRAVPSYHLEKRDSDPRGMTVVGADGKVAGTVSDVWVDISESLVRYLEVTVPASTPGNGAAAMPRTVLLPMNFASISGWRRQVSVPSVLAAHFAKVPALANPNQVTRREEDRICGYYGGGTLYATPSRSEPLI